MADKIFAIDHIRVPYNNETKLIFLRKVEYHQEEIFFKGKKIATQRDIPNDAKKYLEAKGFTFKHKITTYSEGKRTLFEIKLTVQKEYDANGNIRELLVSIPARTQAESVKHKEIMLNNLQELVSKETMMQINASTLTKFVRC